MRTPDFKLTPVNFSQTSNEPLVPKVAQALEQINNLLQRARTLSIESRRNTDLPSERQALQEQFEQVKGLILEVARNSGFKDLKALNANLPGTNAIKPSDDFKDDNALDSLGFYQVNIAGKTTYRNKQTYFESNGYAVTATRGAHNAITSEAQINFSLRDSDGSFQHRDPILVEPFTTMNEIAMKINLQQVAIAHVFTVVKLTVFKAEDGFLKIAAKRTHNSYAIELTISAAQAAMGHQAIIDLINADLNMQSLGMRALLVDNQINLISSDGYEINITTASGMGCNVQLLDHTNREVGNSVQCLDDDTVTCPGVLMIELPANVLVDFSNQAIFNMPDLKNNMDDYKDNIKNFIIENSKGEHMIDVSQGGSAKEWKDSINKVAQTTGVNSTVVTQALISNISADVCLSFDLRGDNARPVNIKAEITKDDFNNLVRAINDRCGTTGITAETWGADNIIKLCNTIGYNIIISNFKCEHLMAQNECAIVNDAPKPLEIFSLDVQQPDSEDKVRLYTGGRRNSLNSINVQGSVTFDSVGHFSVKLNKSAVIPANFCTLNAANLLTTDNATFAISIIDCAMEQIEQMQSFANDVNQRAAKAHHLEMHQGMLNTQLDAVNNEVANIALKETSSKANNVTFMI